VVEGNGASAEKDESERKGGQNHPEAVSVVGDQPVVRGYLPDSDAHINANGESRYAGEQAQHHEQTAKEFGEGGEVRAPARQAEAADQFNVVVQSTENLVIAEIDHDRAESQAHDKKGERLQTIQEAQRNSSDERQHRLQQSREAVELQSTRTAGADVPTWARHELRH
jgi:hypothetical protein